MEASVCIAQKGIVEEVTGHNIRVKIHRESACGNCSAQSICNLTGISERTIEIHDHDLHLKNGDFVDIVISQRMGNRAVFLGYMLPFLLLVSALILFNSLGMKELATGLSSLGILIPYYLILYAFRNKLIKIFAFTVSKSK